MTSTLRKYGPFSVQLTSFLLDRSVPPRPLHWLIINSVPCQGLKHEFVEEEKKQNSFPCTCQFLIFFNTLIRQPVNDSILDDPEFAVYLSFIINDIFLSSFDISILQCREGEKYKIQSFHFKRR